VEPKVRIGLRLRPRWNKVLSDLWGNRVRTILVVASVTVGLFAVGMIATTHGILSEDIRCSSWCQ
jgi:putative ABC transport system permease protein